MKTLDRLGLAESCYEAAEVAKSQGRIEEAQIWLNRCRDHINLYVQGRDADIWITPIKKETMHV